MIRSGHVHTPDGDVLFVSGSREVYTVKSFAAFTGNRLAGLFDWKSEAWSDKTWIRDSALKTGHWYPTLLPLKDGKIAIISGIGENQQDGPSTWVEVYDPNQKGKKAWSALNVKGLENGPFRTIILDKEGREVPDKWATYPRIHPLPDGRFLITGDGTGVAATSKKAVKPTL